jgi:hypothetical protein
MAQEDIRVVEAVYDRLIQPPGLNVIKLFTAVIHKYL